MNCPHCNGDIRWFHIAKASKPVSLVCSSCDTKLIGDSFIKNQSYFVYTLSFILPLFVILIDTSALIRVVMFILGILLIVVPNVYLTISKGRYSVPTDPYKSLK